MSLLYAISGFDEIQYVSEDEKGRYNLVTAQRIFKPEYLATLELKIGYVTT